MNRRAIASLVIIFAALSSVGSILVNEVRDGSISMAKLAPDVVAAIEAAGQSGGSDAAPDTLYVPLYSVSYPRSSDSSGYWSGSGGLGLYDTAGYAGGYWQLPDGFTLGDYESADVRMVFNVSGGMTTETIEFTFTLDGWNVPATTTHQASETTQAQTYTGPIGDKYPGYLDFTGMDLSATDSDAFCGWWKVARTGGTEGSVSVMLNAVMKLY